MVHSLTALILVSVMGSAAGATQVPADKAPPVVVVPVADDTQEIVLKDGTSAIGRVERVDEGQVTFRTNAGAVMQVEISQVLSVAIVTGHVVNGELWRPDSNPTRLFFAPTGRSLKKGEAYLGVYEVWMPFVQVGITDRISFGGGTPIFFGGSEHPYWITPKVQIVNTKSTQAAVGVIHFSNIGDYNMGIAYGVVTQGNADSAVTFGAGYAYLRGGGDEDHGAAPLVMVGGERRVSRKIKLVTENYFFRDGGLVSGGVRFLGERLSVDLGLVSPLGVDVFVAVPMVNFVWKF